MGEIFERGSDIYHMTCDICGKKEDIINKNPYKVEWWCRRHWTKLIYEFTGTRYGMENRERRGLNFCPECTKKFKKLIKDVNLEED